MLYLTQPGERSEGEAEELTQHLRICPKCSEEFNRIQAASRFIEQLRSRLPVQKDPEVLVDAVLSEISRPPLRRDQEAPVGILDLLIDFCLSPAVRFGTAGLTVIAVGLFVIQSVALLNRVNALEGKIAVPVVAESSIKYSISSANGGLRPELENLQKLLLPGREGEAGGRMVVSRRAVEEFITGKDPGSVEMLRLAVLLGRDPHRLGSLVRHIEQHAIATIIF